MKKERKTLRTIVKVRRFLYFLLFFFFFKICAAVCWCMHTELSSSLTGLWLLCNQWGWKSQEYGRSRQVGWVIIYDQVSLKTEVYFNTAVTEFIVEFLLFSLQELNRDLTSGDREKAKASFLKEVDELEKRLEREKQELLETAQKSSAKGGSNATKGPKGSWSDEEVQALIKAVNLFPAGTASRYLYCPISSYGDLSSGLQCYSGLWYSVALRWDVIANFLRQHVEGSDRTGKEVLAKAKDLQKNGEFHNAAPAVF